MRLIDADALREKFKNVDANGINLELDGYALKCIDDAPTIERKKGKWIKGIGENGVTTSLFCSCCYYENTHWDDWNYCPNCGARMER